MGMQSTAGSLDGKSGSGASKSTVGVRAYMHAMMTAYGRSNKSVLEYAKGKGLVDFGAARTSELRTLKNPGLEVGLFVALAKALVILDVDIDNSLVTSCDDEKSAKAIIAKADAKIAKGIVK